MLRNVMIKFNEQKAFLTCGNSRSRDSPVKVNFRVKMANFHKMCLTFEFRWPLTNENRSKIIKNFISFQHQMMQILVTFMLSQSAYQDITFKSLKMEKTIQKILKCKSSITNSKDGTWSKSVLSLHYVISGQKWPKMVPEWSLNIDWNQI